MDFGKKDLHEWDVVELRNGDRMFKLGEFLHELNDDPSEIDTWSEELCHTLDNEYDVMKVWRLQQVRQLNALLHREFNVTPIWERSGTREHTMEELTGILGYDFKIKK